MRLSVPGIASRPKAAPPFSIQETRLSFPVVGQCSAVGIGYCDYHPATRKYIGLCRNSRISQILAKKSGQSPVCLPKVGRLVTTVEMFLKEACRKTCQQFFGIMAMGGWMDALLLTSSFDTFLLNILSKLMGGGLPSRLSH